MRSRRPGGDPRSTYDASLRYRDFTGWDSYALMDLTVYGRQEP